MIREMMIAKLHRATVTGADLEYVGSITIDKDLLDAVGIVANQKVEIVNNNNGARLATYVIEGERGKGDVCLNGAAARLVQKGDVVIIIAYGMLDDEEMKTYEPKVALIDENNKVVKMVHSEKPNSKEL
ncbi:L-aspartate 1-decarboxylase [Dethiosulfatibacter aminovorans DSM 17477]|uniref:Aspartate 1-decarboxylase n=1 Tax=Dethiosulfatibacter aminovorans DSM 17477 TaxID=1121476 RepID=A0A1M6E8C5_9FIRM|nr:aspartate 1-decarboxylase [Dethiosulfatibacter aminovorans]SHI81538.1 L-aspartate 1-decarboxylase [Dethiosulfatibacter aminovorans DSM 17477]